METILYECKKKKMKNSLFFHTLYIFYDSVVPNGFTLFTRTFLLFVWLKIGFYVCVYIATLVEIFCL